MHNRLNIVSWALCLLIAALTAEAGASASDETAPAERACKLWYRQPAASWDEALPLGNGRLGAMIFGGAAQEQLALNEESLWAGAPLDVYPEDFAEHLRTLQRLVLEGRIKEARQLGLEKLTKSPTSFRSYEPLGDLWVETDHGDEVTEYRRELDLETGLARVRYRVDGVRYQREVLISAVDDVLAVRLSADKPGALNATIRLTRQKDARVTASETCLKMDGQIVDVPAPEGYDDNPGGSGPGGAHMKFAGRLRAQSVNGHVRADGETLTIRDADAAVLLFTAATDFHLEKMDFDRSIDPGQRAEAILDKASQKSWEQLLSDHIAEHRSYFNRVSLDLGGDSEKETLPTDARLAAVKEGATDDGLAALYFQYGRYLLMSSSRPPGCLPANLQGLWSHRMWAPWEADYHLNINLQMNYWPADVCNLSETVAPLGDWLSMVAERGMRSADKLYGARGWVAFTAVNLFGRTTPSGSTKASQFQNGVLDPLAGAWMALTLWRHYEFTQDRQYLARCASSILEGASWFLLDYLVTDPDGMLVIVPSTSPENAYLHPETGEAVRISRGSTYHTAVVRAVFEAVIEARGVLGGSRQYSDELRAALKKLPPLKIGRDGTIQEWIEDYEEREPGHRHMSHLIGLHPFAQITSETPELIEAARRTIERRLSHGGGHTGWSRAWIVNFYARLLDGDAAQEHLTQLLRKSTLPNLFNTHPPFQIDGNFGGCAGIAEMLLQSHAGTVHLLPALPSAWPQGSVRGLRARGGFEVDIAWRNGEVASYRVEATCPARLRLRVGDRVIERQMESGDVVSE